MGNRSQLSCKQCTSDQPNSQFASFKQASNSNGQKSYCCVSFVYSANWIWSYLMESTYKQGPSTMRFKDKTDHWYEFLLVKPTPLFTWLVSDGKAIALCHIQLTKESTAAKRARGAKGNREARGSIRWKETKCERKWMNEIIGNDRREKWNLYGDQGLYLGRLHFAFLSDHFVLKFKLINLRI